VRLAEAAPVTGGIALELLELEDEPLPGPRGKPGRSPRRKPAQAKRKAAAGAAKGERVRKAPKSVRKVSRKRH
jgi:ribonuclease R